MNEELLRLRIPPPLFPGHPVPPHTEATLEEVATPNCTICHALITPLSRPFTALRDGTGEASGRYGSGSVPFDNMAELMAQLAADPSVAQCVLERVALSWLRAPNSQDHDCWLLGLADVTYEQNLLQVLRMMVVSNKYRLRR